LQKADGKIAPASPVAISKGTINEGARLVLGRKMVKGGGSTVAAARNAAESIIRCDE
jgi:hypothetical protein